MPVGTLNLSGHQFGVAALKYLTPLRPCDYNHYYFYFRQHEMRQSNQHSKVTKQLDYYKNQIFKEKEGDRN